MVGESAPPGSIAQAVRLYSRRVWSSSGYTRGVPPRRVWRVPPPTVGPELVAREGGSTGTGIFFFPPGSQKKRHAWVSGPLGNYMQFLPWTRVEVAKLVTRSQPMQLMSYADNGTLSFVQNAVEGVETGFAVVLELVGVGYRAEQRDDSVLLRLGYSSPIALPVEQDGVVLRVLEPTKIQLSGVQKEKVHATAGRIRKLRKPDAYKGKGVRFLGEVVRLKPGKKNE